jgi:hypothetical protein
LEETDMEADSTIGSDQPGLIERLERLERHNLRLKRSLRAMKLVIVASVATCAAVSTIPLVQSASVPVSISAQHIYLRRADGRLLAALAPSADGNVLTFFDHAGHKTVTVGNNGNESAAGLSTWDGNNVIVGNGIVRTAFGESNPNLVGYSSGFGAQVLDGSGKARSAFGMSYDLSVNDFYAVDTNGTATGIGIFPNNFAGYFANDLNGVNRQFGSLSLDGITNLWGENDANGALRVSADQAHDDIPNSQGHFGNGFALWDANGQQRVGMAAATDGSYAQFALLDTNNVFRVSALLTTTSTVDTFDATGAVTGHLP